MRGGKETEVSLGKCKCSTGNVTANSPYDIQKNSITGGKGWRGNLRVQNSCKQMQHIPAK